MYFKISKREFQNAILTVSRAISNLSPLPLLTGIKIDVEEDRIVLTGSDADISIKKTIYTGNEDYTLDIKETGSVVIKQEPLINIVSKMDSENIDVEIEDGTLTRFSGQAVVQSVSGMKAADYPRIDFNRPDTVFELDPVTLMKIITQTAFATSDKDTRAILTGVNFHAEGKTLECVATDSYRLAKKTVELEEEKSFNVTIPAKSLREVSKSSNELSRTMNKEAKVQIAVDGRKAQFILGDTLIQTRLIDGVYPDTNRLIPTEFKNELVVDARDILNAIDRASFIKTDGVSIIKLNADVHEVVISSRVQEFGSSVENINAVSYSGDPLEISFSGRYVHDAIQVVEGSTVRISFSGEMKPFIIRSVDDASVLHLILPVRTYS